MNGLRCRPGDLAAVVFAPHPNEWAIGRIVKVTACFEFAGEWYWRYEGERLTSPLTGRTAHEVEDLYLRPIRDPGDDATDEMVQLLGKPQEVAA
jgi:hypothetical protein